MAHEAQTPHPMPLWKGLSFFVVISIIITLLLLLMFYPMLMSNSTQLVSFFSIFLILNFIIPDKSSDITLPNHLNRKFDRNFLRIFLYILLTEFFIFIFSDNFSLFAFDFDGHFSHQTFLLNWPIWLGLWAYFSLTITMQHYAHYHLHHVSMVSGLLFRFKNTYLDIAVRRALGFLSFGINITLVHLLLISIVLIILTYFQPGIIKKFHPLALISLLLLSFLFPLTRLEKTKHQLSRLAFSNFFYLIIGGVICAAAIWISAIVPFELPTMPLISTRHVNVSLFLFISFFITITPMLTSLIVKQAADISRKKLLLLSFLLPNCFYFLINLCRFNNKIVFIILTLIFMMLVFRKNTTANFMTGVLSIPKQRAILPVKSYLLFPAHCLIPFNFYLLITLIGPTSFYSFIVAASLLSMLLTLVAIISYFGKTYRKA